MSQKKYHNILKKKPYATIRDIYPYYVISNSENQENKKNHKIAAELYIQHEKNKIIAHITLDNKSNHDYFVFKDQLPSGDRRYSELCGSSFLITMGNIKLDYLGRHCKFESNDVNSIENNWKEIKAGEKYIFSVILNRAYEFLPETHQYTIGSLEFSLVTKEWFLEYNINRIMFAILNKASLCPINTGKPLAIEKRWLCAQYIIGDHDLRRIFRDVGIDGGKSDYYFKIRTNQIVKNITATDDSSYYLFMK